MEVRPQRDKKILAFHSGNVVFYVSLSSLQVTTPFQALHHWVDSLGVDISLGLKPIVTPKRLDLTHTSSKVKKKNNTSHPFIGKGDVFIGKKKATRYPETNSESATPKGNLIFQPWILIKGRAVSFKEGIFQYDMSCCGLWLCVYISMYLKIPIPRHS